MKKLALTLVFLVLVNVMGVFSVSALDPTTYDGSNDVTVKGTAATVEKVPGVYGKETSDMVYKITGGPADRNTTGVLADAMPTKTAQALEFSFMIPTGSSGLRYSAAGYGISTNKTAGYFYLDITAGAKIGDSEVIENNKWYRLAITASCDGTGYFGYLNGESVGEVSFTHKSVTKANNGALVRQACIAGKDADDVVYIDDLTSYVDLSAYEGEYAGDKASKAFNAAESAASYVQSVASGWNFDNDEMKVYAPAGAKKGDLDAAITTTDETADTDEIRVYNSEFTKITDENAEIIGNTLVIAAKNTNTRETTYSYYAIEENDLDSLKGRGKNASDITLYDENSTFTSVAGNYGKLTTDEVYEFTTTSGNGIHLAKTFNNNANTFGGDPMYYHLEYSFALTEGAVLYNTLNCRGQYNDAETETVKSTHVQVQVIIDENRIRNTTESNATVLNVEINEKQWYTLGIDVPKSADDEAKCNIYLNGKLLGQFGFVTSGKSGAWHIGGFRQPTIKTNSGKTVYMDNISMKANYDYEPLADTPRVISANKAIAANGKLSYITKPASLSDFTKNASTVLRLCDADMNSVNDMANAAYIVAAEKDAEGLERVLEYYAIDAAPSKYISGGYFDASAGEDPYKIIAYGVGDAKIITATYSGSKLSDVNSYDFKDIEEDKKEISLPGKVRAFVWNSYTGLVPLTDEIVFDYVR